MTKRLALVAYHFPPENAAGAARPYRFYKYLPAYGYERHVFTAAAPEGQHRGNVLHIPDALASHWEGKPQQHLNRMDLARELFIRKFLVPGGTGFAWSRDVAREFRKLSAAHADDRWTVFASYPPLGCLLTTLRLASSQKTRIIADYRDPYSLSPGLAGRAATFIDRRVFHHADLIIANTDTAADAYRSAFPNSANKVEVIWNGFDPEEDIAPLPIPRRPYRVLAHAGALYSGRSPDAILYSVGRLRETGKASDIRVELLGGLGYGAVVDPRATQKGQEEGWLNFVPRQVPRDEAMALVRTADVLLLIQPQSSVQVPGKLFEYLRIGRPILAYAPRDSAIERLLSRSGVPYVCVYPQDTPEEIDAKLVMLFSLPAGPHSPSSWFTENFDARYQTRRLAELADNLHS